MIREVSGGPVFSEEVDLIEVGIFESGVLKNGEIDHRRLEEFSTLRCKFSIHGPFTHDFCGNAINLCSKSNRIFEVMENVFKVADYLDAEHIVMHADTVQGDYSEAFLNVVSNFKQLAKMAANYNLVVLMENLHRERESNKVGLIPQEILKVIQLVDEPNLKFCFDVGHGTLSANQYGFNVLDFITKLSPYLCHMHIHDNMGIPDAVDPSLGDQHLPLGQGKIQYQPIFQAIAGIEVKNTVLELRPKGGRAEAMKSISVLKALQKKRMESRRYQ